MSLIRPTRHGPPDSVPFIPEPEVVTGERFQALADLTVASGPALAFNRKLDRDRVRCMVVSDWSRIPENFEGRLGEARTLFVYGHELLPFLRTAGEQLSARGYRLISHNSDCEVGADVAEWISAHPGVIDRLYAQNVLVDDTAIVPLPIGIANRMWRHGRTALLARRRRHLAAWEDRPRRVVAAFTTSTHSSRLVAAHQIERLQPFVEVRRPRRVWSFRRYLRELAEARYCVCPRGNGLDTHRTWEALYMGARPIVERSPFTRYWQSQGVPLVVLDDWACLTPESLAGPMQDDPHEGWESVLRLETYHHMIHGAK